MAKPVPLVPSIPSTAPITIAGRPGVAPPPEVESLAPISPKLLAGGLPGGL